MNDNDKPLFFITISLICIWVILDNIFGKKYLDIFLSNVFDFYGVKENKVDLSVFTPPTDEEKIEKYDTNNDGKVTHKEAFEGLPSFGEVWDTTKKAYGIGGSK